MRCPLLLLAPLATGCLDFADTMVFLDAQREPAATGLLAWGVYRLEGGVVPPDYHLESDEGLLLVEKTWRLEDDEGYELPEDTAWLEAAGILSSTPGDHDYDLVYWDGEQAVPEPAHAWFEEPAGFGADLSPWRPDLGWMALDHVVIHRDISSVATLQPVTAEGVPLVGDGDVEVLEDGSGLLGDPGDVVEIRGGHLPYPLHLADGVGGARLRLLDGSELTAPGVTRLQDYDAVTPEWRFEVIEWSLADHETPLPVLILAVADPADHPFLFADAVASRLYPDDDRGSRLVAVDGLLNDGSVGCRAEFEYDPDEPLHALEICVGTACVEATLPGDLHWADGIRTGCPW